MILPNEIMVPEYRSTLSYLIYIIMKYSDELISEIRKYFDDTPKLNELINANSIELVEYLTIIVDKEAAKYNAAYISSLIESLLLYSDDVLKERLLYLKGIADKHVGMIDCINKVHNSWFYYDYHSY